MQTAVYFPRLWAMPSKDTFTIKPIRELLAQEINGGIWLDPYVGLTDLCSFAKVDRLITNDLNPDVKADYHYDALGFLKFVLCWLGKASVDGIIFDPPYTLNQLRTVYENAKQEKAPGWIFNARYFSQQKDAIGELVKPGGKVISFGYNSVGIGKKRGFEITRGLLVSHGRLHNDTIVTVEVKGAVA